MLLKEAVHLLGACQNVASPTYLVGERGVVLEAMCLITEQQVTGARHAQPLSMQPEGLIRDDQHLV